MDNPRCSLQHCFNGEISELSYKIATAYVGIQCNLIQSQPMDYTQQPRPTSRAQPTWSQRSHHTALVLRRAFTGCKPLLVVTQNPRFVSESKEHEAEPRRYAGERKELYDLVPLVALYPCLRNKALTKLCSRPC